MKDLLNSDNIWLLIPLAALMFGMVKALSRHQVQMAEIIHRNQQNVASNDEVSRLRDEVKELRAQVNSLTLALDGLAKSSATGAGLERRLDDVVR